MGDLTYLGQKFYNDTAQKTSMMGSPKPQRTPSHPLANFSNLQKEWNNLTTNIDCQAPKELYWICEKQAYTVLPCNWFGSYMLGSIRPFFFPASPQTR
jgi:hypothetical protein